jgi:hypothetical protein
MFYERAFNFERTYPISRALDYVVGSAYEPEVTIFIFAGSVAGVVPSILEDSLRLLWVVGVSLE